MARSLTLLHRAWRLLPVRQRRRLYELVTTRAAPPARWTRQTPRSPCEPFIVAGSLTAPTGLGEAARQILRGVVASGAEVSAIDLARPFGQQSVVPLEVAREPAHGPGTLLLVVQPPSVGHALNLLGRRVLRHKLRIGCWVWELQTVPPSWHEQTHLVHALAAPSRFAAEAFSKSFALPVRVLRYPIAAAACTPPQAVPGITRFGAAMDLGSTAARKNPLAVLHAYRRAFAPGEPVSLTLKLREPEADPEAMRELEALADEPGPPVTILTGDFTAERMEAWWQDLDVLVSLHRSEGFGLLPAEAMLRGIPAISTDWSATAEFVTAATGWPIPARIVPVVDRTERFTLPGAVWAEPDLDAAIAAMRESARDPGEVARRGVAAAEQIQALFSLEQFWRDLGLPAKHKEAIGAGEGG